MAFVAAAAVLGCAFAADKAAEAECNGNVIRLYTRPLSYEVEKLGKTLVPRTEIGLCMNGTCLARDAELVGAPKTSKLRAATLATPVYKKSSVKTGGVETLADFGDFAVRLVARDDGVAYRIETRKTGVITCEKADLSVPKNARCWFNRTPRGKLGHEETVPEFADASALTNDVAKAFYLPFVFSVDGKTVAVTESDIRDYPVLNFGDVEDAGDAMRLRSLFAKYPKTVAHAAKGDKGWANRSILAKGGRWIDVIATEDFIAKAEPPRVLPWRVFIIVDAPSKLCEADMVYALAEPAAEGADFSWVKPGKVAWDWWNGFDNKGEANGCNTETYERFIDFAAETGVEYVILDEGWSAKLDIWRYNPAVDVPRLIEYAGRKGVGIILWMAWAQVYGDEEHVAEHFAKLGAKGFKVDFIDRADAVVATFLDRFAAACAKNRMVVDYHGIYRPSGLQRKYPNILNFEGIHGLEQMKWAKVDKDMCLNDVACFFLRMTAGPMDYTPGAMDNYAIGAYRGSYNNPGSVGTRAHQMALMALYEAPLQMLSDSPTKYEANMECFSFMAKTPVVWDRTVGLGGCPETFAAAARMAKDGSWFAAGITNKDAREVSFKSSFLGEGEWKAEMFRDAEGEGADARDYVHETKTVKAGDVLTFKMSSGGGFIVRFSK